MPSHQELTDIENARIREALRQVLPRYPSQRALADALGFTPTTVSMVLSGKALSSFGLARRLADLLGVHVLSLLGGESMDRPGAVDPLLLARQLQGVQRRVIQLATTLGPEIQQTNPAAFEALAMLNLELSHLAVTLAPGGAAAQLQADAATPKPRQ